MSGLSVSPGESESGAAGYGALDTAPLLGQRLRAFRDSHPPRSATVSGQEWCYLLGGVGERAALLLHGSDSDGESLFTLMASLERDYRTLTPTYPAGVASVAALVDGLEALLDALDISSALVVGYSLGGYIAQALAWRHPARVAGLALFNTGAPARSSAWSATVQNSLLAAAPTGLVRAGAALGAAAMLRLEAPGLNREERVFWRTYLAGVARRVGKERMRAHGQLVVEFLGGQPIAAPESTAGQPPVTLIVDAGRDRTIAAAERRALHRRYPSAIRVTQPNAGHLSVLTRPEPYLAAIAAVFPEAPAAD